jgi:hypothetical protein
LALFWTASALEGKTRVQQQASQQHQQALQQQPQQQLSQKSLAASAAT